MMGRPSFVDDWMDVECWPDRDEDDGPHYFFSSRGAFIFGRDIPRQLPKTDPVAMAGGGEVE